MGFISQLFRRFGLACVTTLLAPSLAMGSTILVDPWGDAMNWGVSNGLSPDIVTVSAGYDSTSLYLRLAFVPGTLDPANFGLSIGLDTDLNVETPYTGYAGFVPSFQGAEYTLSLNLWTDQFPIFFGTNGAVQIASYECCFWGYPVHFSIDTGITPDLSIPDEVRLIIPLNLLGSDDGVMRFGATASKAVAGGCLLGGSPDDISGSPCYSFVISDYAIGSQGLEKITTPIPEPSSIPLLLLGMLAMLRIRKLPIQRGAGRSREA